MRVLGLIMVTTAVGLAGRCPGQETKAAPTTPGPATRPFLVAPDTTFFTGPVRADGTVDYVEAVNQRMSRGVTPANNAAVPLIDAIAPGAPDDREHYAKVRAKLGPANSPAAPTEAKEFPPLVLPQELDERLSAPWTAEQAPEVAKWLEDVAGRLELAVQASRRERYYVPLVRGNRDDHVPGANPPHLDDLRRLVKALRGRAMLRLGHGDVQGFRQDTVAIVRLGRLASHGATILERLVGIACEASGLDAIRVGATGKRLAAKECEQILTDLRATPAAGRMHEVFDLAERSFLLEFLLAAATGGERAARQVLQQQLSGTDRAARALPAPSEPSSKDWNAALRKANGWYDRLAQAGRLPTYAERAAAAAAVTRDLEALKAKFDGWRRVLAPVEDRAITIMIPPMKRAYTTETRIQVDRDLTQVALALSAFRSNARAYPASLRELVPGYFNAEPMDAFTNQPFEYQAESGGYVLRSLGENGREDPDDSGDDRVVRAGP